MSLLPDPETYLPWLLSTTGALTSAEAQADAYRDANLANAAANQQANALNYQRWREGRGLGGHAVLPEYFGEAESELGNSLIGDWMQRWGKQKVQTGTDQQSRLSGYTDPATGQTYTPDQLEGLNLDVSTLTPNYETTDTPTYGWENDPNAVLPKIFEMGEQTLDKLRPTIDQGTDLIGDIFSDTIYGQRLGNQEDIARTRKGAINEGLQKTIGELKALRSARGGGTSSNMANQMASAAINAQHMGSVQDAYDRARIFDENTQLKMQSLNLPYQQSQMAYEMGMMPEQYQYRPYDELMQRLNFFNIGPGAAPQYQPYRQEALPNSQMALGGALNSLGGAWGSYNNLMEILNSPLARK